MTSAPAQTRWRIVCDNLDIHVSESVVRLVAHDCGLTEPLGEKGKSGILCRPPRARPFCATPATVSPSTLLPTRSWINQIEIWFSILVRKVIRRGNFTSKQDLNAKIPRFITHFNETLAKPFRWTYAGRPLTA